MENTQIILSSYFVYRYKKGSSGPLLF